VGEVVDEVHAVLDRGIDARPGAEVVLDLVDLRREVAGGGNGLEPALAPTADGGVLGRRDQLERAVTDRVEGRVDRSLGR
jgi:hypothetical protein